jgi:hypothetical protein
MTCARFRQVASFDELISTPFAGDVNALCWPRRLPGDFEEVAARLDAGAGITTIGDDTLASLALSPAGSAARDRMLADLAMMREQGLDPVLDCIRAHPRAAGGGPIPTDVYSYHVDRATDPLDTFICTYTGPSTEALPNEMAMRRIDDAETRAELLKLHGGPDDESFAAWLTEHFYDLHYAPLAGAEPYAFGIGNVWRIAIDYPGCPVLPCVHRAPLSLPGAPDRLLLLS